MTGITADALPGSAVRQQAFVRWSTGQQVAASILGPTRSGLSITVGAERYQLTTASTLPEGKALTLQVLDKAADGARNVQIVAIDGRPLPHPIAGDIAARPSAPPQSPASGAVIQHRQIDVAVQPVTEDGRALGSNLAVRLSIQQGQRRPDGGVSAGPGTAVSDPMKAVPPRHQRSTHVPEAAGSAAGSSGRATGVAPVRSSDLVAALGGLANGEENPAPLTARVVGRGADGQLLLRAAGALLKIEQSVDLPVGAELQLTPLARADLSMPASIPDGADLQNGMLTRLIEALESIERAGGQAVDADLGDRQLRLPQADEKLAARVLSLLQLLAGASAGEQRHGVSRDGRSEPRDLKDQIHALLSNLGRARADQLVEDWRSVVMPIGTDPGQAVVMFFRSNAPDPDGKGSFHGPGGSEAKRVVFEVAFSRLGRCQLDALCRDDQFDMIVRSERPLDQACRGEVRDLFASACELSGMTGEIGFRTDQFFEPARSPTATRTLTT